MGSSRSQMDRTPGPLTLPSFPSLMGKVPSGTVLWAFRIGYLGDGLFGVARQPGKPTVEGLLLDGLKERGLLPADGRIRFASRTDRGVHALGNVIALDCSRPGGRALAGVLNSLDPRIFCLGFAPVPLDFDPVRARSRRYRYLLPSAGLRMVELKRVLKLFEGRHDFTSFSRKDHPPRDTVREVTRIDVSIVGAFAQIDVEAPSFLWGQVRKIVGAAIQASSGKLTRETLLLALAGQKHLSVPLAPPEGLTLMDVSYAFSFDTGVPGLAVKSAALSREGVELARRATLLGWFSDRVREATPNASVDTGCSRSQERPST